jgi:hypothetical protein
MEVTGPQTADKTCHCLQRYGWDAVAHTRHRSDVASRQFHLLDPLKSICLASDVDDTTVKQAVTFWLQTLATGFFNSGLQSLMPR